MLRKRPWSISGVSCTAPCMLPQARRNYIAQAETASRPDS
ncbi:hypothetical protein LG3211_4754 [Lysobacter gummosus]|nr:hypothetical protein LG3211_4754 [Lysobacter gummosus]